MKVPKLIKKNNREYILEKVYNSYALYSDLECGYKVCYLFHDLDLIVETVKPTKKQYKDGIISLK